VHQAYELFDLEENCTDKEFRDAWKAANLK
jgi:hypothetical protein